jgi:hypothetical protein
LLAGPTVATIFVCLIVRANVPDPPAPIARQGRAVDMLDEVEKL